MKGIREKSVKTDHSYGSNNGEKKNRWNVEILGSMQVKAKSQWNKGETKDVSKIREKAEGDGI